MVDVLLCGILIVPCVLTFAIGLRFHRPWGTFLTIAALTYLAASLVGGFDGVFVFEIGLIGALFGAVIAQIELFRRRSSKLRGYQASQDSVGR